MEVGCVTDGVQTVWISLPVIFQIKSLISGNLGGIWTKFGKLIFLLLLFSDMISPDYPSLIALVYNFLITVTDFLDWKWFCFLSDAIRQLSRFFRLGVIVTDLRAWIHGFVARSWQNCFSAFFTVYRVNTLWINSDLDTNLWSASDDTLNLSHVRTYRGLSWL